MSILVKFREFRVISFKLVSYGVSININRVQPTLPMLDLLVVRAFGFGLSLSKWI